MGGAIVEICDSLANLGDLFSLERKLMEGLDIIINAIATATPWNVILGIVTILVTGSLSFVFGWFVIRFAVPRIIFAVKYGNVNVSESLNDFTKRAYDREEQEWQDEFNRDSMHYFD